MVLEGQVDEARVRVQVAVAEHRRPGLAHDVLRQPRNLVLRLVDIAHVLGLGGGLRRRGRWNVLRHSRGDVGGDYEETALADSAAGSGVGSGALAASTTLEASRPAVACGPGLAGSGAAVGAFWAAAVAAAEMRTRRILAARFIVTFWEET